MVLISLAPSQISLVLVGIFPLQVRDDLTRTDVNGEGDPLSQVDGEGYLCQGSSRVSLWSSWLWPPLGVTYILGKVVLGIKPTWEVSRGRVRMASESSVVGGKRALPPSSPLQDTPYHSVLWVDLRWPIVTRPISPCAKRGAATGQLPRIRAHSWS